VIWGWYDTVSKLQETKQGFGFAFVAAESRKKAIFRNRETKR